MRKKCGAVLLLAVLLVFPAAGEEVMSTGRSAIEEEIAVAAEHAVEWLLSRKVPNETIGSPLPWRRNLVLSYDVPEDDPAYRYLKGRSYIYDDALAAIAFTMHGRLQEAENLLFAMSRQLRSNGSIWFGVNVHNDWPSEKGHAGATVRSGASAWAGYAATYYIRHRLASEPDFDPGENRVARRILFFAEKTARRLLALQITDEDDPRYGLVTGGMGTYSLEVSEDDEVKSVYSDEQIGWVSAEHNLDAYFLFADLAGITGGKKYGRSADMVAEGLLSMWNEERRQIIQGIKEEGRKDSVLPLDTSSWGSMFLRAAGYSGKAEATLAAGIDRFEVDDTGTYRPYADDRVYLDESVSRYYLGNPDAIWDEIEIDWPEGALGMATACFKAGRTDEALQIIEAHLPMISNGALPYASREIPHQFSTYPSVASTAWLVIAAEHLFDEKEASLFWEEP